MGASLIIVRPNQLPWQNSSENPRRSCETPAWASNLRNPRSSIPRSLAIDLALGAQVLIDQPASAHAVEGPPISKLSKDPQSHSGASEDCRVYSRTTKTWVRSRVGAVSDSRTTAGAVLCFPRHSGAVNRETNHSAVLGAVARPRPLNSVHRESCCVMAFCSHFPRCILHVIFFLAHPQPTSVPYSKGTA